MFVILGTPSSLPYLGTIGANPFQQWHPPISSQTPRSYLAATRWRGARHPARPPKVRPSHTKPGNTCQTHALRALTLLLLVCLGSNESVTLSDQHWRKSLPIHRPQFCSASTRNMFFNVMSNMIQRQGALTAKIPVKIRQQRSSPQHHDPANATT